MGGSRGIGRNIVLSLATRGVWLNEGAVEVLTKYMAKELGLRRIAVNVVAPALRKRISAAASCATIRL